MSFSFIPVKLIPIKDEDKTNQIYFSRSLMKRLGINNNHHLQISFGKKFKSVPFQTSDIARGEIHLSETIINEFLIPFTVNDKFLVKYMPANQTLYLGPVVALLTDFHSSQKEDPHFRSIHHFCEELQQRVKEIGGIFYVFNIYDFDGESVHGYYFDNGNWVYAKLPLPNVIYNRIHSRRFEQVALFKSFRSLLKQLDIPLFNDHFLSKWEVYQHLILENKIQPHLPETCIFSQQALFELIDKYNTLYIKPIHGSQGKNIFKLIKGEQILCQTSQNPVSNQFKQSEIFYHLKPLLHNKIYIIQQGVPLAEYQDKAMDFRVLVHKNQHYLWEVTSLVARISAEQQFVSNLAKGGKIMKPFHALQTCFNKEQSLQLISSMKELSILAADTLSRHTNGLMGELGIDIGVDRAGNLWIIEVNSKPSKNFEDTLAKIRPSAKAVVQFCTILSFDEKIEKEEST